jgi:hypothetical protein
MAKKKSGINFKQILMQKGERYGFYVAGGLLLLFLFLGGYQAITSASTSTIVDQFKKEIQSVDQKINRTGEQPKPIDPGVYDTSTVAQIPFVRYPVNNELFNIAVNEQTKRLNPHLFPPIETQMDFVRGSINIYDIITDADGNRMIAVITNRPKTQNNPSKINRLKKGGAGNASRPAPAAPPPLPPTTVPPRSGPGLRPGGIGGPGMQNNRTTETTVEYKKVSDPDIDQAAFAQTIDPRRMVVVTASIPYKAQVEEYRRALRAKDVNSLSEYPEYRGFIVERRMLSLDGKTLEQDWTVLDLQTALGELFSRVVEFEPENPPRDMDQRLQALYPRIVPEQTNELLVPRPKLYRGDYPSIVLQTITDALKKLAESGQTAIDIRTETEKRLDENNIFTGNGDRQQANNGGIGAARGPAGGLGFRLPPGMRTGPPPAAGAGPNNQPQRVDDEEAWLMRFIDVTVEPGHAYQYRVTLKAKNPNYHRPAKDLAMPSLAEKEMLHSEPYEIDKLAIVPPEDFLYAATKDDRKGRSTERMPSPGRWDHTWVQMQRWFGYIRAVEFSRAEPFGEWLVADIAAIRGQYVGETAGVTLPVWFMSKGMFLFRDNPRRSRPAGGVFAGSKPIAEPTWTMELMPVPPVLLVDFEGGNGQYVAPRNRPSTDVAGVEMLFLTADGKLIVSRSGRDINDADRVKREDEWTKWLKRVEADTIADKSGSGAGPGAPGEIRR